MELTFYNQMRKVAVHTPYDYYKSQQQALINAYWDNTTTLTTVQEQVDINTWEFSDLEVRLNHVIEEGSTSLKNGDDFRELIFKSLDHSVMRGLYYKFSDNYWITTFTDEAKRVTKDVIVRRCNNKLKWRDKIGIQHEYPCVIDYELSGGKPRNTTDIVTPTNEITVIVQSNIDTKSIEVNQRFIFNNRPYKIGGYNNYLQNDIDDSYTTLLYFDMYVDEVSPYDNLTTGIANEVEPSDIIISTPPVITYPAIKVIPITHKLLQGESVTFSAHVYQTATVVLSDAVTCNPSGANLQNYILESLGSNQYKLTNVHRDNTPLVLEFSNGTLATELTIALFALL